MGRISFQDNFIMCQMAKYCASSLQIIVRHLAFMYTFIHTQVVLIPLYINIYIYISHCHGNVHLNKNSKSRRHTLNAWCMILNWLDVRDGQSALDDALRHSIRSKTARCTLPRGPGLSPICRNMIGLASRFGFITAKCRPIGVNGFQITEHSEALCPTAS